MTGTLGANAMWDWMPYVAGLKLVRKALMPTGIQHMELKESKQQYQHTSLEHPRHLTTCKPVEELLE